MQLKLLLLFFLCLPVILSAQEKSKFQFGLQSGNNLSPSDFGNYDEVDGHLLLRYSFGVLVKQDVKKNVEVRWGGLKNRIYFYLHYGLNFVAKGYDYSIGEFSGFSDEYAVEIPFLLFIKAGNNVITRSWDKKKLNVYTALGIKYSYSPNRNIEQIIGQVDNSRIEEKTKIGGSNVLFHGNYGIMKTSKRGAITGLGIGVNIGTRPTARGQLNFIEGGSTRTATFFRNGSYFSLDLHYFFGKSIKAELRNKRGPVLFCPHL